MMSQVLPLPNGPERDAKPARGELAPQFGEQREPSPRMGEMLVASGRLSGDDVQLLLDHQARTGMLFGETGITLGLIDQGDVQEVLAAQFGYAPPAPGSAPAIAELPVAAAADSGAAEHLRALRSQLMLRWFENDDMPQALAIVSPGAGEGRSWIAANLALLFAQVGKRTILVDADLRRPRQHQIFGVPGRVGLSAVLAGRAGSEAIVELTATPGLWLLPAGVAPPNPQELLARPAFAGLMAALRSTYDVILLDTPPTESCADAGVIAARAGAALVVACRDRSSVPRLGALSDDLRHFGVTMVGAVLNGVPGHARAR